MAYNKKYLWSGKLGDRKLKSSKPISMLGTKPTLYPIINLTCLCAGDWRGGERGAAFDLRNLFSPWASVLAGCPHAAWRRRLSPLPLPCLGPQHPPPELVGTYWLSFPALVKTDREVGNGLMITAELDLYEKDPFHPRNLSH